VAIKIVDQVLASKGGKRIAAYFGVFLLLLALLLFRGWLKKRPARKQADPVRTEQTHTPGGAVSRGGRPAESGRTAVPPEQNPTDRVLRIDSSLTPEKIDQNPFAPSEGLKVKYDEIWGTQISKQVKEKADADKKKAVRAPRKKLEKKIELQATLVSPNGNVAILDGEEVSEGDTYLGYSVTRIGEWSVHLEKNGKMRIIEYSE